MHNSQSEILAGFLAFRIGYPDMAGFKGRSKAGPPIGMQKDSDFAGTFLNPKSSLSSSHRKPRFS